MSSDKPFFCHESSYIDEGAKIGAETKIWHFTHIMSGAVIGRKCSFGQNVNVDRDVMIGNNVKVQNNVSIYSGTIIEDDVFLGPSCVLTNVTNPRSQINRHSIFEKTIIRRGATIGANATIVCGVDLGRYCFIGAGAVVTKDVPDYALMVGNPARQHGWMSRHGHHLIFNSAGIATCPESGYRYQKIENENLRSTKLEKSTQNSCKNMIVKCLDLCEEDPLPENLSIGNRSYKELKHLE